MCLGNLISHDEITILHDNSAKTVAENRNLPVEEVMKIADGSTVLGDRALELGLIDQIGSRAEAEMHLGTLTGQPVEVCAYWYEDATTLGSRYRLFLLTTVPSRCSYYDGILNVR